MTDRPPFDRTFRVGSSLPLDRRVLAGAVGVFAAVLVVHYVLPHSLRTDAVQVSLSVLSALAVGFAVGDESGSLRSGALTCGLGGALCSLIVAFEAAKRGVGYGPVVTASAVVLPALFAALGAMGVSTRKIVAEFRR